MTEDERRDVDRARREVESVTVQSLRAKDAIIDEMAKELAVLRRALENLCRDAYGDDFWMGCPCYVFEECPNGRKHNDQEYLCCPNNPRDCWMNYYLNKAREEMT